MRFLFALLIPVISIFAQSSQPPITEFSHVIYPAQLSYQNGFFLTEGGTLIAKETSNSLISSKLEIPRMNGGQFLAIGIKANGNFVSPDDLDFVLTLDDEVIRLNAYEESDPASIKSVILTPLYFAKPGKTNYSLQINVNRQNIEIKDIEVIFINPGKSNPILPASVGNTEDTYPKPPVVTRTQWGCPQGQSSGWGPSYTTVTHLIIHHTDDNNNVTDWPAAVRAIWQYHTFSNGWGDVGYNYLVDPNGIIYEGRAGGDNVVGAHFCGTNGGTMGVSMLGTYSSVSPSAALQASLGKILAWKADQSWALKSKVPLSNSNNQTIGLLGVFDIITERKEEQAKLRKTQQALLESNERYMDLYEFAPVGYLTVNESGMVSEANWKARSILGIKRKDLGKERFAHFVSSSHKKYWQTQFALLKSLQEGAEQEFELNLSNEEANTHVDVKLSCVRTHAMENQSMVRMTLFDISDMKEAELELRQKEAYQRSLLDNFPFMVWLKDKESRFLTVNQAFLHACGAESLDQVIGKTDLDFWTPDLADSYRAQDKAVMLSREPKTLDAIIEVEGKRLWFEAYKSPVIVGDKVVGTVGFARDISNRRRMSNYEQFRSRMLELVVSEENLQVVLDNIVSGLEQINPAMFCLIALLDEKSKQLQIVSAISLPDGFVKTLEGMKVGMGIGSLGTAVFTKQRVIIEDVTTHPYAAKKRDIAQQYGIGSSWAEPIIGSKGNVLGAFGIYHHGAQTPDEFDITLIEQSARLISIALERNESISKIAHLAYYDDVTGLPNRRFLFEQVKRSMAMNLESGANGALMYIDLDQFKTVNDSRGHDIGDMLLLEVANRLRANLHAADTIARAGGDEFVVLLEGLSGEPIEAAKQVELVIARLLRALNKPYTIAKQKHHITASVGITLFGQQKLDGEEILQQADIAMFQAKKSGRNTYRFFDPKMQANITALVGLESELRKALGENQLRLYYQVQVDHLGQPFGAEALIRWIHPERGMISPADFIPLAEETGLILPIGAWVLDSACAQIKAWQSHASTRELTLSVNISAKQFRQLDFVQQVKQCIEKYGIDPMYLRLELTESMLLEDVEQTVEYMNTLGQVGVQFSLDDFGTGYSSLQYLKRLPLYQLKIDQSFVRDIVTDSHDRTIVRTIIAMAQSMYIGVIAEGVETLEQRELLLTNGCRRYQGFYFGKPMDIEQFNASIKAIAH